MAAVNPLKNQPVLPPAPTPKPKQAESTKAAEAQPKTLKVAVPASKTPKLTPVASKPKAQPVKVSTKAPSIPASKPTSKVATTPGKAAEPRHRINIVG